MRTDLYTAEAICQSMGLPSFDQDPACLRATAAMRLLLKPSFHPEICLTFTDGKISVVSARFMIWHQFEPSPMLTDRAEGWMPDDTFIALLASTKPVAANPDAVPGLIIDGMPSELLCFSEGAVTLRAGGNAGRRGDYSHVIGVAITAAWERIANPHCRNALVDVAGYVDIKLPRDPEPDRKPTVETMVLGAEDDRMQVIEALRKIHGR